MTWFQAWVASVLDDFGVLDFGVLMELPVSEGMLPVIAAAERHLHEIGTAPGFSCRSGGYEAVPNLMSESHRGIRRSADAARASLGG